MAKAIKSMFPFSRCNTPLTAPKDLPSPPVKFDGERQTEENVKGWNQNRLRWVQDGCNCENPEHVWTCMVYLPLFTLHLLYRWIAIHGSYGQGQSSFEILSLVGRVRWPFLGFGWWWKLHDLVLWWLRSLWFMMLWSLFLHVFTIYSPFVTFTAVPKEQMIPTQANITMLHVDSCWCFSNLWTQKMVRKWTVVWVH